MKEAPKKEAPKKEAPTEEERKLETFRTEYRRLIGGAIIEGLLTPGVTLASSTDNDYDQYNGGNYTQIAGDHDQTGGPGDYNQSVVANPGNVIVIDLGKLETTRKF